MLAQIGTVSSGTLRNRDLLESFADQLERLDENHDYATDIRNARRVIDQLDALDDRGETSDDVEEEAGEIVRELDDALYTFAPPYCYFGTLEGDGAEFGFWPDIERVEDDARSGELLKVSDLSDIPADWIGPVALVNDHGNMTLGHTAATFREDWSVV